MTDTFAMARARRALQEAGLDYQIPIERASSVTNEVWLTPEFVIRVNRSPNQRLRREAFLGPLLPPDVNYPQVVAYGGQLGADWLIVRRQPGNVLSRCWPAMTPPERREAVRQFANVLRHLHQVVAPADLPDTASPQLLDGHAFRTVQPLLDGLAQVEGMKNVDPRFIAEVRDLVEGTSDSIEPFNIPTLIHGDLHFENILWDSSRITALLDFEYARSGPPDLDLDVFLRFCAFPFLHVAEDYEHLTRADDYAPIPYWLAEDYPELFDVPRLFERTVLYSIAYDVRDLLDFPPPRPPRELSKYHPYNRLENVVRERSYLHRLAGQESWDILGVGYDGFGVTADLTPPLAR